MVSFAPLGLTHARTDVVPRLAPWAKFLRHSVADWVGRIPKDFRKEPDFFSIPCAFCSALRREGRRLQQVFCKRPQTGANSLDR